MRSKRAGSGDLVLCLSKLRMFDGSARSERHTIRLSSKRNKEEPPHLTPLLLLVCVCVGGGGEEGVEGWGETDRPAESEKLKRVQGRGSRRPGFK